MSTNLVFSTSGFARLDWHGLTPGVRRAKVMKLPRWLLITMLTTSVLVPLAAAGWSWVTWPERTAREFQILIAQRQWDDATAMMLYSGSDYPAETVVAWLTSPVQEELRLEHGPQSWVDVCRCRRQFRMGEKRILKFTAERGRVTKWNTWGSSWD